MVGAAGVGGGEDDFRSFAAGDPERVERMAAGENVRTEGIRTTNIQTTNVRTIFSSIWTREGEELIYTVRGSGFLHHMVRNLVGTFLLVGKGTVSLEGLRRTPAPRERTASGPTPPPTCLYLL